MSKSVRVLSGNLWFGRADPDALVALLRQYEVDVFATQELGFECAEAISEVLPYGCLEPHETFQGMGIAASAPIDYSRIPLEFRPARRAVLDPKHWHGLTRPLALVNVHFQAPHSMSPFPSFRVRAKQASRLEQFFDAEPSDARIVVGDYNAAPGWPLYHRMARRFTDQAVVSARREGREVEPTWGPGGESRRLFRIDQAMGAGVFVENFRVIDLPGSDHSGLLFDCTPEELGDEDHA